MANNTEDVELRYSIDPASDEGDFTALTIMRGDSVEWILTGEQAEVVAALIQQEANRQKAELLNRIEARARADVADDQDQQAVSYIYAIERERNKLKKEGDCRYE